MRHRRSSLALAALSRLTVPCHKPWAHEIRAWIDLTTGTCHGVVAAARTGTEAAPRHSAAIQLTAQQAKAWARTGGRSATEVALDKGRRLLEACRTPTTWTIASWLTPTRFDFYSMDCYRHLAEDRMAEMLANEVIQASTGFDGTEHPPCDSPKRASPSAS